MRSSSRLRRSLSATPIHMPSRPSERSSGSRQWRRSSSRFGYRVAIRSSTYFSAIRPGGLSLLDVHQSRPLLRRSRLFPFRHVRPGRGFEPVSADVCRLRPQGLQNLARLFGVGDEPLAFHVRLVLTDQPLLRIPGTAAALACDTLDAAPFANVLRAKSGELSFGPDLDVIVLASSRGSGLRPAPAFGLRDGTLSRRHTSPCRLRLLDVLPGGLSLFCSGHFASLSLPFSLGRKQGATVGIADCGLRIYELV